MCPGHGPLTPLCTCFGENGCFPTVRDKSPGILSCPLCYHFRVEGKRKERGEERGEERTSRGNSKLASHLSPPRVLPNRVCCSPLLRESSTLHPTPLTSSCPGIHILVPGIPESSQAPRVDPQRLGQQVNAWLTLVLEPESLPHQPPPEPICALDREVAYGALRGMGEGADPAPE